MSPPRNRSGETRTPVPVAMAAGAVPVVASVLLYLSGMVVPPVGTLGTWLVLGALLPRADFGPYLRRSLRVQMACLGGMALAQVGVLLFLLWGPTAPEWQPLRRVLVIWDALACAALWLAIPMIGCACHAAREMAGGAGVRRVS